MTTATFASLRRGAPPPLPASARDATLEAVLIRDAFVPDGVEFGEEIGRGANNRAYAVTHDGHARVLRMPRRGSDTQQRDAATAELRHTLRAAELGAAPAVHAAWHARHASTGLPSGLYMITERFPHDLEAVLSDPDLRARVSPAAVGAAAAECLRKLAADKLFVYDLKPSNLVLQPAAADAADAAPAAVRLIDYGSAFCEWGASAAGGGKYVAKLAEDVRARGDADADAVVAHVLFATMLVVLSATTTYCIYHDRRVHRMGRDARKAANPFATLACELLDGMQGRNIALVRALLRTDEVRGTLGHYHGRRRAGTRRTLALACGGEL